MSSLCLVRDDEQGCLIVALTHKPLPTALEVSSIRSANSLCTGVGPALGCLAQEETEMRDKSKGVDGKKRRKKKPPELKEPKKR